MTPEATPTPTNTPASTGTRTHTARNASNTFKPFDQDAAEHPHDITAEELKLIADMIEREEDNRIRLQSAGLTESCQVSACSHPIFTACPTCSMNLCWYHGYNTPWSTCACSPPRLHVTPFDGLTEEDAIEITHAWTQFEYQSEAEERARARAQLTSQRTPHDLSVSELTPPSCADLSAANLSTADLSRTDLYPDADLSATVMFADDLGAARLDSPIPIERSCVIDVDSTLITPDDLTEGAIHRLDKDDPNILPIQSGSVPVTSFNNPDFRTLAFPALFCYGIGGCDDSKVPLKTWVKHLLSLKDDDRFCTHYSFMFVVHSVLNVRNVCLQTSLNITRNPSDPVPITSEDMTQAIAEIDSSTQPTDPNVRKLWHQLRTVARNIVGSNFHRGSLSYEIKALMLKYGLPTFFVTINPNDIEHPLVMHFAGKQVNLDDPFSNGWLPKAERAKILADNPVAAAKFFHTLIEIWLETIIGIRPNREHDKGVLGRTQAYYGTVETQGRGSLHLHILFWVNGNVADLQTKLEDAEFAQNLLQYLGNIIYEQFPNGAVPTSDDIDDNVNQSIASQRPLDPDSPNFATLVDQQLTKLVQKCLVHKHTSTCYKYGNSCRFEFPRPAVEVARIEDNIIWLQRKTGNQLVNNYNDIILLALKCNHDIKFITNGRDGKAVAFYICSYITKSALTTHNAYPIICAAQKHIEEGVHRCQPKENLSAAKQLNRQLVIKCLNKLTTHAERSGPEIASLLLGHPLHYTDHLYERLYLNVFMNMLEPSETDSSENFSISKTGEQYIFFNQKQNYLLRPRTHFNISLYDFTSCFYKRAQSSDTTITEDSYLFEPSHREMHGRKECDLLNFH